MSAGDFMQLILLLLLLMSGSSSLKDVKPLSEEVAGEDASRMLEEVEQLTSLASAFAPANNQNIAADDGTAPPPQTDGGGAAHDFFPLAPISGIADENITYSLSRYISTGQ